MPNEIPRDHIDSFDSFLVRLASFSEDEPWKEHWNIFEQHDGICFYRLSRDDFFNNVTFSFKILVNKDMIVTIYKHETQADSKELSWILNGLKLLYWSQFYKLLEYYQTEPVVLSNTNPIYYINSAIESLNKIWNPGDISEIIEPIKQQLQSALIQLNANEISVKVEIEEPQSDSLSPLNYESINSDHDIQVKNEPFAETMICTPNELNLSKENKLDLKKVFKKKDFQAEDEVVKCEDCQKILPKSAIARHYYNVHVSFNFKNKL